MNRFPYLWKAYLTFYISVIGITIIIFYFLSIYFGNNPLNNSIYAQNRTVAFFPQGWAFFTTNANGDRLFTFKVSNSQLTLIGLKNLSFENCLGLSRDNRILNLELHNTFQQLKLDSSFNYHFNERSINDVPKKLNLTSIKYNEINISSRLVPDINGAYLFVVQEMLPWSLLHIQPNYPSDFTVYPVKVSYCENCDSAAAE